MPTFLVKWEISEEAASAIAAARQAWQHMRNRGSIGNVFTVVAPDGEERRVDLEDEVPHCQRCSLDMERCTAGDAEGTEFYQCLRCGADTRDATTAASGATPDVHVSSSPTWVADGDVADGVPDHARLSAVLRFPEFSLHLQAIEVVDRGHGWEAAYDAWHDEVEAIYALYTDTALETAEIDGRQYFVCAHPFGD